MVSKIIFNLNYQIMEKEPVRVLTLFQYFNAMGQKKKKKKTRNKNKTKQNKKQTNKQTKKGGTT